MIAYAGLTLDVTTDDARPKPAPTMKDPTWFEQIFQEHWARVYRVLYRLVGDHAEAEDLALETFWRLYRRPPRRSVNLGGWLYRVATNLGLNALRARQRRGFYERSAGRMDAGDHLSGDPAVQVESAEEIARVRRTLVSMNSRSAKLLVLRHSGLTYAELAATLDVAPGSIGTLLARAEKEFAERYQTMAVWKDGKV
jgi:RNA polymerase sigma-70 factor (ECF subfamily)